MRHFARDGNINVIFKYFSSVDGKETLLKDGLKLQAGEIIDAATMSKRALTEFFEAQIEDSKKQNILLSLHLKVNLKYNI